MDSQAETVATTMSFGSGFSGDKKHVIVYLLLLLLLSTTIRNACNQC